MLRCRHMRCYWKLFCTNFINCRWFYFVFSFSQRWIWFCLCGCVCILLRKYIHIRTAYVPFLKCLLDTRISVIVCVYNKREQKSRISSIIFGFTLKFIRTFLTVYKNILKWPEVKRWRYACILRVVTIRVKILISQQKRIAIDILMFLVIAKNCEIIISTLFKLAVRCYLNIFRACKFLHLYIIYINLHNFMLTCDLIMLTCDLNITEKNLAFNWWNFSYFLSSEIAKTILSFWICETQLLFFVLLLGEQNMNAIKWNVKEKNYSQCMRYVYRNRCLNFIDKH